jgi:TPR repeat protein
MPFDEITEHLAFEIFSHVADPRDRVALAATGRVWRNAKKLDASLPGTPGELYELGRGFSDAGEYWKELYWYLKASDRGDADAMWRIAICSYQGYPGVTHYDAFKWLERASALERAPSHFHATLTYWLARCYVNGHGVERDPSKAIELLVKAATEMGCRTAAIELAYICQGSFVDLKLYVQKRNVEEALKWFRRVAELGELCPLAQARVDELERELAGV